MQAFPILFTAIVLSSACFGQEANKSDALPYFEIPDYPENYTPGSVAARVVDGLGFRYHWATEGLRQEDLSYRPSEGARSLSETVDHIYGLVAIILKTAEGEPYAGVSLEGLTFEQKRHQTLKNLYSASQLLKREANLEDNEMVFQRQSGNTDFPFWNLLNGPIADAINHTGQVITFRRTAGNPINPKISVLSGRLID